MSTYTSKYRSPSRGRLPDSHSRAQPGPCSYSQRPTSKNLPHAALQMHFILKEEETQRS